MKHEAPLTQAFSTSQVRNPRPGPHLGFPPGKNTGLSIHLSFFLINNIRINHFFYRPSGNLRRPAPGMEVQKEAPVTEGPQIPQGQTGA
ncbi:hypothetical protein XELAEV_18000886mg [Xenopus laevis]|nr:hypothetical protein XELAEV_18000886mg [Xenopus laevis]